jgi:hypothetical protein
VSVDADAILGRYGPEGERAARWLRDVVRTAGLALDERPRAGWVSLTYHHTDAGYVVGVFPRQGHAQLVVERGAALDGFADVFDEIGGQVAKVVVRQVPDARRERIVDAIAAAISARVDPR